MEPNPANAPMMHLHFQPSTGNRQLTCCTAKPASSRPRTPRTRSLSDPAYWIAVLALLVVAFGVVPLVANQYWLSGILIPFLIFALAAIGLNILTGYAGQLSLGTAAFMAVGAFAAYNFMLRVPGMPILLAFAAVRAALVGIVFGLPSLRIKGFYLAVATLAAQFFVVWALTKFSWFSNNSSSGVISAQRLQIGRMFHNRPHPLDAASVAGVGRQSRRRDGPAASRSM